jgi:hypothetical protein
VTDVHGGTVALAAIPAAIATAGTWLTARNNRKAAIAQVEGERDRTVRQIEGERDRTLAQINAELERLREQHREDHLRNRQSTYHDLLNANYALTNLIAYSGPDGPTTEQVAAWHRGFTARVNGIELFAPEEVRQACRGLQMEMVAFGQRVTDLREVDKLPFGVAWSRGYVEHRDRMDAAEESVIEAMRRDVAQRLAKQGAENV